MGDFSRFRRTPAQDSSNLRHVPDQDFSRFRGTPEQEFLEAARQAGQSLGGATRGRSYRPGSRGSASSEDKAAVDTVLSERRKQTEMGQINPAEAGSQEPGFFGLGGLRGGSRR